MIRSALFALALAGSLVTTAPAGAQVVPIGTPPAPGTPRPSIRPRHNRRR